MMYKSMTPIIILLTSILPACSFGDNNLNHDGKKSNEIIGEQLATTGVVLVSINKMITIGEQDGMTIKLLKLDPLREECVLEIGDLRRKTKRSGKVKIGSEVTIAREMMPKSRMRIVGMFCSRTCSDNVPDAVSIEYEIFANGTENGMRTDR